MRALPLALTALLLAAAPASGAIFLTPSGNISCETPSLHGHGGVTCTLFSATSSAGEAVWEVKRHGHARHYHVQANAASEGHTLGYGDSYRGHGIVCTSRTSGLRCHNHAGHGFSLSRATQTLF